MRYIGSKLKLLETIKEKLVEFIGNDEALSFCDLFAGTNCVGDYFQDKYNIISNDNLYFCYILGRGKLIKLDAPFNKLGIDPFEYFNSVDTTNYKNGYCYNNFAPTKGGRMYFSDENAKKIDFIRETIDIWFKEEKISLDEHDYLLACLLESVSKVSNVAGVYAAFLRTWDSRAIKPMQFIKVESINEPSHKNNIVYNEKSETIIEKISGDILYLDPPYTSTQYISQYHVLETIAKNDKPEHHGVGAHRDNGDQISMWSKKYCVYEELYKVLSKANFKYIVMSYSDAGLMSKKYIEAVFKRFCGNNFKAYSISFIKYKNTRAVIREAINETQNSEHFEYLFIGKKTDYPKFISPLNYIGGKYDILDFLLPKFPVNVDVFYDLFGGGATVGINAKSKSVIYNDLNYNVVGLLDFIKENSPSKMYEYIDKTIKKYGLEKSNKETYIEFRKLYNSKPINQRKPLDLYLLICFGFEHQIRFNSKMEFNNPCGNSGFNDEMLEKLISFSIESKIKKMEFNIGDYKNYKDAIKSGDFVYCDPPYLLTCGAYNDGKRGFNGWDEVQQKELLAFLDELNSRNVRFALSSIIDRNNQINVDLKEWIERNNYNLYLNEKITKRNRQDRIEALITNY